MKASFQRFQRFLTATIASLGLIGCQAMPGGSPTAGARPILTLDAAQIVDHLATRTSVSWQDNAIQPNAVRERRRAANYHVQAATLGKNCWNVNIGACSNAPAFVHVNTDPYSFGSAPVAGDALFAVNDANPAVVYKLNPGTGTTCPAVTPGTGVTQTLTGHQVTKSAILASADNKRIYVLTNDGWLYSINVATHTLTTGGTNPVQLPTAAGATAFSGRAPFLDSSQIGGVVFGTDEMLYAVDSAGVIFKVHLVSNTGPGTTQYAANPAVTTITPAYSPALGTATVSNFPIVWKGTAYLGTSGGVFYAVNTASGTTSAWDLRSYSPSAQAAAQAIIAPAALDFDNALNVNALFVPFADRVIWLDPAVAGTAKAVSPSLGLDHAIASGYGPVSSVVGTSGSYTAPVDDWISIAKSTLNAPTSWSAVTSSTIPATAVNVASVKRDPVSSDIWFSVYAPTPTYIQRSAPNGTQNALTPGNTDQPNELTVDSTGVVYATNATGTISKYTHTGVLVAGFPKSPVTNPLWPQIDNTNSYLWVTDYVNGQVWRLDSNGVNTGNGSPWAITGAYSVACDAANNIWVTTVPGNGAQGNLLKFTQGGKTYTTYTNAKLINAVYVACSPATGRPWIACNTNATTNNLLEFDPAGPTFIAHADGYTFPYAINFNPNAGASNGEAWVSHTDNFGGGGTPRYVTHMNATVTGLPKAIYNNTVLGADPQEIAIDGAGGAWIACNGKILNIFDIGNQADLFAARYFKQTTEAPQDESYAYMRFRIPGNQYGGGPVTGATLSLMAANATGQTETLNLYQASNLAPNGTKWKGYAGGVGTNTVDAGNSPVVGSLAAPLVTAPTIAKYQTASFTLNSASLPTDQPNAPAIDTTNGYLTLAFTNADTYVLNQVTHWFSNATQSLSGDAAAVPPTLKISYLTSSSIGATGIACQPSVISYDVPSVVRHVVVGASNALIELDYSSVASFQDPTKVYFNLTQAGSGVTGTLNAAKQYLFPTGNVLVTENLRMVMADANPTGPINLNSFDGNLPATTAANRLRYYDPLVGSAAGNVRVGQQMLYDYTSGFVYCTTSNGNVYRESVLQ